jgi:hypothetical protein
MRHAPRLACAVLALAAGCATTGAIRESRVSPEASAPRELARVALPPGRRATAAFVAGGGDGILALSDGSVVAVSPRHDVHAVDRLPGDVPRDGETPTLALLDRGRGSALALGPSGALVVEHGVVRGLALPPLLAAPRAFALVGGDAMWATRDGLYVSFGDGWVALEAEAGPVRDVAQIASFDFGGQAGGGARDAWVRAGARLTRVRLEPGPPGRPPRVTFVDPTPGVSLGAVRAIARMDLRHGAIVGDHGVTVVGPDGVRTFHGDDADGLPDAIAGGGGFAWVLWHGRLLRTDGVRWEALAGGVPSGPAARIAVDADTGTAALVVDGEGGVLQVDAGEGLMTSGLVDGATVFDTRLELEVVGGERSNPKSVTYVVDGKEYATRGAPPWGWGPDGGRAADIASLSFAAHQVEIRAKTESGRELRRLLRFRYASPLGRVPTYAVDVAPIFKARCGRCHASGAARDLSRYESLSANAAQVRAAIREGRMPPDLRLDRASAATFVAWVDGDTPE